MCLLPDLCHCWVNGDAMAQGYCGQGRGRGAGWQHKSPAAGDGVTRVQRASLVMSHGSACIPESRPWSLHHGLGCNHKYLQRTRGQEVTGTLPGDTVWGHCLCSTCLFGKQMPKSPSFPPTAPAHGTEPAQGHREELSYGGYSSLHVHVNWHQTGLCLGQEELGLEDHLW